MNEALQSPGTAPADSILNHVFYHSPLVMMILNVGTRTFTEANAAAIQWLGYEKAALLQMPPEVVSNEITKLLDAVREPLPGNPLSTPFPMTFRHANKTETEAKATASAFEQDGTTHLLITVTGQDFAQQNKEDVQFHASLFKSIKGAIVATDEHFNVTNYNGFAKEMFGWEEKEVIGNSTRHMADTIYPSVSFEQVKEELFRTGKWEGEVITHRKNGEAFPAYLTVGTVTSGEGTITGTITIIHDLTERKKTEQEMKKMNASLQQQVQQKTEEINEVFERVSDAVVAIDKDWHYTYVNSKAATLLQRKREDLLGKNIWKEFSDTDAIPFRQAYEKAMAQQQYLHFEHYYAPYNAYMENHIYPSPNGLSVFIKDITAKKLAEETMAASERRFKALVEQSSEGIMILNEQGIPTYVSAGVEDKIGYTESEVLRFTITSNMHPDDAVFAEEKFRESLRQPGIPIRNIVFRIWHKKGDWIWIQSTLTNYLNDPDIRGVVNNFSDITALKLRELQLSNIADNLRGVVLRYRLNANGTDSMLYVSKGSVDLWGIEASKAMADATAVWRHIHEEDYPKVRASLQHSAASGLEWNMEWRYRHPNGSLRWQRSVGLPQRTKDGTIIWDSLITDITELKQSEETNAFQAYLLNTIGQAIVATDKRGTINFWNKAAEAMYGWAKREVLGKQIYDFTPPPRSREAMEQRLQQLEKGGTVQSECTLQHKNGEAFPALVTDSPILDAKGNLSGIISIATNIAQQKKTEYEMALLLNNTEQAFMLLNSDLRIVYFNQQFQTYYKTTFQKEIQKDAFIFDYAAFGQTDELKKVYRNVLAGLKEEYERECTGGMSNRKIILLKFFPARDEHQTITGVFITLTDITARRIAEEEKLAEQRNKEALINTTDDLIWSVDNHYRLVAANSPFYRLMKTNTGADLQPGDYLLMENSYTPQWLNFWKKLYNRSLQGESFMEEMETPSGNGTHKRWEEIIFKPVWKGETVVGVACYSRNVTQRKLIEQKIRETLVQQQLYSAIVQSSDDGIISQTPEGFITSWNRGAQQIFGYEAAEMEGQPVARLIPAAEATSNANLAKALGEKRYVRNFETVWLTKQGKRINISLTASPIVDEDGNISGASLIARDITDLKAIETKVKKSEERFRTLFEQNLAGFYEISGEGRIVNCNLAFAQMLKYSSPDELKNKDINTIYFPDFDTNKFFGKLTENQQIQNHEGIMKCKDGTPLYFLENVSVRINEGESNPVYDGIILDITERTQALQALRSSNERYDLAAKATSDVIWDWNVLTNEVIRSAESMQKVFGYGRNILESSFSFWSSKIHPDDINRIERLFEKKFADPQEQFMDCEYRFLKADGSYAYVYDKGYIIRNGEGKPIRMIGAVQDISRIKESELMVKKRAEELEASNRELEQFAYVASHDLQEPLRMVTNFLTQLQKNYEAQLDDRARKYIHFAVDGAVRMRQIILDLLEYSRVGRTNEQKEEVNLNHIMHEIEILFQRKINDKKALLTFTALPSLVAYKPPLRQLFQNLISNALTYTNPAAQPRVHVWAEDKGRYWQFAITDNGIGIEPDYFEKIFVIFQRLHTRESYAGTGMGLAIAKKIVENMGGTIWVTSQQGEGSTFYFTLPKEVAPGR